MLSSDSIKNQDIPKEGRRDREKNGVVRRLLIELSHMKKAKWEEEELAMADQNSIHE